MFSGLDYADSKPMPLEHRMGELASPLWKRDGRADIEPANGNSDVITWGREPGHGIEGKRSWH